MRLRPALRLLLVAIISQPVVWAQPQDPSTIMRSASPVFLRPDSTMTPLATMAEGQRVTVLESESDWTRIAFADPVLGRRIGFVASKDVFFVAFVEPKAVAAAAPTPPEVPTTEKPAQPPEPQARASMPASAVVTPKVTPKAEARPAVAIAATPSLISIDRVNEAIAVGSRNRKKQQHGLVLVDQGQIWTAAMAASLSGYNSAGTTTGFSVVVYTPIAWIRQRAASAAKEYRRLTPNDVSESDRAPVLRVTVSPDTPSMVTANGMVGTSSVQHVVLRDEARSLVVQPTFKEETVEEVSNAMGGRKTFQGVIAQFPAEGLRELRGPTGDGEFFITVIGATGEEKNFKVKRKHFEQLPQ